jgi:hypothetical protein
MPKKERKPVEIVVKDLPKNEFLRILAIICKERDILELDSTIDKDTGMETLLDESHILGATITPLVEIPTSIIVFRSLLESILKILTAFDQDYVELAYIKDSPLQIKLKIDQQLIYLYLAPRMIDNAE